LGFHGWEKRDALSATSSALMRHFLSTTYRTLLSYDLTKQEKFR
jgi:hypothetical protein